VRAKAAALTVTSGEVTMRAREREEEYLASYSAKWLQMQRIPPKRML
jgi:hypothetical protein